MGSSAVALLGGIEAGLHRNPRRNCCMLRKEEVVYKDIYKAAGCKLWYANLRYRYRGFCLLRMRRGSGCIQEDSLYYVLQSHLGTRGPYSSPTGLGVLGEKTETRRQEMPITPYRIKWADGWHGNLNAWERGGPFRQLNECSIKQAHWHRLVIA